MYLCGNAIGSNVCLALRRIARSGFPPNSRSGCGSHRPGSCGFHPLSQLHPTPMHQCRMSARALCCRSHRWGSPAGRWGGLPSAALVLSSSAFSKLSQMGASGLGLRRHPAQAQGRLRHARRQTRAVQLGVFVLEGVILPCTTASRPARSGSRAARRLDRAAADHFPRNAARGPDFCQVH